MKKKTPNLHEKKLWLLLHYQHDAAGIGVGAGAAVMPLPGAET